MPQDPSVLTQASHAALPNPTHDEFARQEFVRSYKQYLVTRVHGGNRARFDKALEPRFEREHGRAPRDRFEVRDVMTADPYYQMFSALLRTSQEMMWSSCQKPVARALPALNERVAATGASAGGTLRLDPELAIPRYHTAVDIHCQPGGYHSEFAPDDASAGMVYDRAVHIYAMGQMGPYNNDIGASVAAWLRTQYPGFAPRRILDMGCAVGHSTIPYVETFPTAEVHAIDVAAPMLRYAHARAESLGAAVHFSQQNAEHTDFPDGHFDLVVSHILLHETSASAIRAIVAECHRLLAPGGMMAHAETPPYQGMDPFDAFMLDWDTRNNNEPFWAGSHEIDLGALSGQAGFDPAHNIATLIPSAFQAAEAKRSKVFQGGDFGGGGLWFVYGNTRQAG
ncbi:MAG: class I SAM-dependent methyltransferase [Gammaproteobacteria bacterium]